MEYRIAVLGGDGIGPEVVAAGVTVLKAVGRRFGHDFDFLYGDIGEVAADRYGEMLPRETLRLCERSHAILFGAQGGPAGQPARIGRGTGLLELRRRFDLFANLRPITVWEPLLGCSSLRPEIIRGADYVIVRELTGGLIYGRPKGLYTTSRGRWAVNTLRYREREVERLLRVGFELATQRRQRLALVAQSNVLETSRLWEQVTRELAAEYADVEVEYLFPDNAAVQILRRPTTFDVIVIDNALMAGMLNDVGSVLMGSMGLPPSASLGPKFGADGRLSLRGKIGLYEPVHGSAPHRAGLDMADPIATILSAALMCRYSFDLPEAAAAIEQGVQAVLRQGYRTYDIMEPRARRVGTQEMGDRIAQAILQPGPVTA
ncbi:MAG TPA: 3-isopropylmalate dehydrogenase [Dehalococcoidia bacterium]|nr:3-isopropylmalate dehydrogenase [Dehalococcoidia bacterium]